jgi:hypothetical protein
MVKGVTTMTNQKVWDATKVGTWLDAKFHDEETGEIFLVEFTKEEGEDIEDFIARCQEVADENFSAAKFDCLCSGLEADYLGYDTY